MSKCFCHLNGYEVKDKEARTGINNLNTRVGNVETDVEALKSTSGGNSLIPLTCSLKSGVIVALYCTIFVDEATAPANMTEFSYSDFYNLVKDTGGVYPASGAYAKTSSPTTVYPVFGICFDSATAFSLMYYTVGTFTGQPPISQGLTQNVGSSTTVKVFRGA